MVFLPQILSFWLVLNIAALEFSFLYSYSVVSYYMGLGTKGWKRNLLPNDLLMECLPPVPTSLESVSLEPLT